MKKYIKSSVHLKTLNGSFLVDRRGDVYEVILHAPSTTFIDRDLLFLSPSDANFLFEIGKISEEDLETVIEYNFKYFMENERSKSEQIPSIMDLTAFDEWAELSYAKSARTVFMKLYSKILHEPVNDDIESKFKALTNHWYKWLQDNFVKLSIINKIVEFRITSDDGYDWNDIIIDNVLLEYDWREGTRFNILKEDPSGYKAYFFNATLDEILENDNVVMAAEDLPKYKRTVERGHLTYQPLI